MAEIKIMEVRSKINTLFWSTSVMSRNCYKLPYLVWCADDKILGFRFRDGGLGNHRTAP